MGDDGVISCPFANMMNNSLKLTSWLSSRCSSHLCSIPWCVLNFSVKKKINLTVYSPTSSLLGTSFQLFLLPLLSEVLKLSLLSWAVAQLHPLWLQRLRIKELAKAAWVPRCTRHGLSLGFADLGPRNPKGRFSSKGWLPLMLGSTALLLSAVWWNCWPLAYVSLMDVAGWLVLVLAQTMGSQNHTSPRMLLA